MKKEFLPFKTLCLLLCVGVFASCSSKKSIYETLIPVNEKSLVAGIKLNQVLTKSDIKTLLPEDTRAQLLYGAIQEEGLRNFVADLINDAGKTGLNCDNNTYVVLSQTQTDDFDLGIYLSVDDLSKLNKYIASNSMYELQSEKVGNYNHAVANVSGQPLNVLYNKDIFMLTSSDDLKSKTESSKTLTAYKWSDSFNNSDDFTLVAQSNFIQNISQFFTTLIAGYPTNNLSGMVNLPDGLYQSFNLNFEKGQVVYSQKMLSESAEAQKILDASAAVFGKSSDKFVSNIAADPFMYINTSVHGDKILSYLEMVLPGILSADKLGEDSLDKLKEGLDGVDGEFTFAVSDVNINFLKPSVDFSVFCEAKPSLYPFLVKLIKESNYGMSAIQFETENILTLSERGFTVYLVNAGDHIILTTDQALSENPSMKMESDFSKSRYYNKQSEEMFIVLDIQKILNIPMVQMALSSLSTDKYPGVADFISTLDYGEASGTATATQTKIVLKNKEDNSLKLITALLKSLAHL